MTLDDWLLNLRQCVPTERPALMLALSDWLEEHNYLTDYVVWARRLGTGEWVPARFQQYESKPAWCWFDATNHDLSVWERRCAVDAAVAARIPRRLLELVGDSKWCFLCLYEKPSKWTSTVAAPFRSRRRALLVIMEAVIALAKESA